MKNQDERKQDYRGRPLHDTCHKKQQPSLLSAGTLGVDLKGLFVLHFIIVFAQNARLVLENFSQYGIVVKFIPSFSLTDTIRQIPAVQCFIMLHVFFYAAFVMEKYISPRGDCGTAMPAYYFILISVNCITFVAIPYYTVYKFQPHPIGSVLLLMFALTWGMKIVSFHHVCLDVRRARCRGDGVRELCANNQNEADAAERYPAGLSILAIYKYMWVPSVTFQFHYPGKDRVEWMQILRHVMELLFCIVLAKILIEQYVALAVKNTIDKVQLMEAGYFMKCIYLIERTLKVSVPFLYVWLLMFMAVFHHWLNILGELTGFGDRRFYSDWWNADGFGEYWRTWNLPIHNFCNRHVHKPLLRRGFSPLASSFVIFLFSALAHELLVVVPLGVPWNGLITLAFLSQVPLMYLTNTAVIKRYHLLGNGLFWLTFCFVGQPAAILVFYYIWSSKV